jgi:hypothetical protein
MLINEKWQVDTYDTYDARRRLSDAPLYVYVMGRSKLDLSYIVVQLRQSDMAVIAT